MNFLIKRKEFLVEWGEGRQKAGGNITAVVLKM
jgi:hypothetical protein